ncbi:MAG: PAS domain-containing protein [Deferrisomatales bacterium]|nr:PAS domain-containing protein [Deferrisomatales bacterium]
MDNRISRDTSATPGPTGPTGTPAGATAPPPCVLLVDDEPSILDISRGFLRAVRCEVVTAGTAEEALQILAERTIDVLVTDHSMPGVTGVELLEQAGVSFPDTVRVLYTGVVDTRIAEQALNQARAFRFLVKPFTGDRLREVVADALEYRRRGIENRRFREETEVLVAAQAWDLNATNAFLEGILGALPAGVLVIGPDFVVARANEAAARILGLEDGELVGRSGAEVGFSCRLRKLCADADGRAACKNREVSAIRPWGLRRTVLWSCERVCATDGSVGKCVVSFLDITEEKNLQLQVYQAKQEIEAIFDSITDPTFLLAPDLRILRANRSVARMVCLPLEEILGRTCREVLGAIARDCDRCSARRTFQTGNPTHTELRTPDGTLYSVHFFPLLHRGRVEAVVGRYRDVTSEQEMERRLLHSEKMASIGQLAAGVAHEINNPVGFILSNLNRMAEYAAELAEAGAALQAIGQEALSGKRDPRSAWIAYFDRRAQSDLDFLFADQVAAVAECREGAERIRKIVSDLRTFSHPHGQDWEQADLNAGLESTLHIAAAELKQRCEVRREYGRLPPVTCRPQQLNQVFLNLLVNAAQAIPDRGTVTVRTRAEGEQVLVSVTDTGEGMAAGRLSKIFDPFFTTKSVDKGTGLGLHIAANIVRSHGGEIRVESQVGAGTTFTVILPVAPPEAMHRTSGGDPAGGEEAAPHPVAGTH